MATFSFERAMRTLPLAALAAAAFLSPPALAEDASASAVSPWVKLCQPDSDSGKQACMTMQRLMSGAGKLVATATIREAPGTQREFIVSVPTGVALKRGLVAKIDDNKPIPLKYQLCLATGCYAQINADDAFVGALKAGGKLTVTVMSPKGKAIALPMTLIGFTKAYDGSGVDAEAAKAQFAQLAQLAKAAGDEARARLAAQKETDTAAAAQ